MDITAEQAAKVINQAKTMFRGRYLDADLATLEAKMEPAPSDGPYAWVVTLNALSTSGQAIHGHCYVQESTLFSGEAQYQVFWSGGSGSSM